MDKFPRRYTALWGRDQACRIRTWAGIALYMGVSVSTARRMARRTDDPLPVKRTLMVRGVWIEESVLIGWMGRHELARSHA